MKFKLFSIIYLKSMTQVKVSLFLLSEPEGKPHLVNVNYSSGKKLEKNENTHNARKRVYEFFLLIIKLGSFSMKERC